MITKIKRYFSTIDKDNLKKKFIERFKFISEYSSFLKRLFYILLVSYVCAAIVNLVFLNVLTKNINLKPKAIARKNLSSVRLDLGDKLNYNRVIEPILDRNIFNAEGIFPKEKPVGDDVASSSVFDENAQCEAFTLPLTVQGVLLMNTDNSLVIIREPNYSEADVYAIGDSIIDNEDVIIAGIDDKKVVFNNDGKKECVYLFKPLTFSGSSEAGGGNNNDVANEQQRPSEPSIVTLRSDFVEKELGPGFAKAISSARFVPNIDPADGSTRGFKIFSIRSGSLFSKAGLSNGDIIKSVNDISLLKAEQGFALYEAFQNEREIRIELERKSQPVSKTVRVIQ